MAGAGPDGLSFLGTSLPPAYELLVVTLAPGAERPFAAVEFRDAIVVVERGRVELEGPRGGRARFTGGDVLCPGALPLCALHNDADELAVLSVVRRRALLSA